MRRGSALVVASLVLGAASSNSTACTSFRGESEPDASTDAPLTDASPAGDGASPRPIGKGQFCTNERTKSGPLLRFCADFEDLTIAPFVSGQEFEGSFLKVEEVDKRKAARVFGTPIPDESSNDVIASPAIVGPFSTISLAFSIRLQTKLSPIELITLFHEGTNSDDINLYVDGDALKIRHGGNDTSPIVVPIGVWVDFTFLVTSGSSVLTRADLPANAVQNTDATLRSLETSFDLGIGVWYKQGAGNVNFALSNIAVTATPR